MKISTRGRYALRVMIDLAEHAGEGYTSMKSVTERQNVSLKYLEKILPQLVDAGMIEGVHGKGGGYRLTREPKDYCVGEILQLAEGDLAPVACLECGAEPCANAGDCRTLSLWQGLDAVVKNYLDSVTIADLMKKEN
ncbi:MAG: RrF2 family transcriptional regulator [Clostridia bacterium]|nr:RrF2 family transcriptional regulator [Clostridia bacterium]